LYTNVPNPFLRSWFGLCPVSLKIGSLKMCSGCKLVGYFGKEEQKTDWPEHKAVCKAVGAVMKRHGIKHVTEKVKKQRGDEFCQFDPISVKKIYVLCTELIFVRNGAKAYVKKSTSFSQRKIRETWFYHFYAIF
jgi:hypothetical protein